MYRVKVGKKAKKFIRSKTKKIQRQIINHLRQLGENPRPENREPIKGAKDVYRIRTGDYRIIYQVREKELVVLVVRIGDRKDMYLRTFS